MTTPLAPLGPQEGPAGAQPARPRDEHYDGADEAARDFTALVLSFLVREMFESTDIGEGGAFGSGPGAEVYRGFAVSAFSRALAETGALAQMSELVAESLRRDAGDNPSTETGS